MGKRCAAVVGRGKWQAKTRARRTTMVCVTGVDGKGLTNVLSGRETRVVQTEVMSNRLVHVATVRVPITTDRNGDEASHVRCTDRNE